MKSVDLYDIGTNEYFDAIYFQVFLGLVLVMFVAAMIFFYYLVAKDSQ